MSSKSYWSRCEAEDVEWEVPVVLTQQGKCVVLGHVQEQKVDLAVQVDRNAETEGNKMLVPKVERFLSDQDPKTLSSGKALRVKSWRSSLKSAVTWTFFDGKDV